jgi:hypothetical protein
MMGRNVPVPLRPWCWFVPCALVACGARTGLDVLDASADATTHLDASHDVHDSSIGFDVSIDVRILPDANVQCTTGYFIDLGNGTVLRDGCVDGSVPTRACVTCGEDCITTGIIGCDDAGTMIQLAGLGFCGPLTVGSFSGQTQFHDTSGLDFGPATIDVDAVGVLAATGDYDTTLVSFDGGAGNHLHGAFCVHP